MFSEIELLFKIFFALVSFFCSKFKYFGPFFPTSKTRRFFIFSEDAFIYIYIILSQYILLCISCVFLETGQFRLALAGACQVISLGFLV